MIADSKILCAANYQNRIMVALKPEMLKTTNIREKDPIFIIYEDDQIVIKKQTRNDVMEVDIVGYMEKAREYKKFYTTLEKDVAEFVSGGERKGAIKIDNLLNEARRLLPGVEIDKKIFFNEMRLYFKEKNIKMYLSEDRGGYIFEVGGAGGAGSDINTKNKEQ